MRRSRLVRVRVRVRVGVRARFRVRVKGRVRVGVGVGVHAAAHLVVEDDGVALVREQHEGLEREVRHRWPAVQRHHGGLVAPEPMGMHVHVVCPSKGLRWGTKTQ